MRCISWLPPIFDMPNACSVGEACAAPRRPATYRRLLAAGTVSGSFALRVAGFLRRVAAPRPRRRSVSLLIPVEPPELAAGDAGREMGGIPVSPWPRRLLEDH